MSLHQVDLSIKQSVLTEYDDVLLGRRQNYSAYFTSKKNGDIFVRMALKYCFEYYLHWTPTQVRDCLTLEIAKRMKIVRLIKRVPCPLELDAMNELYYVAWFLYPETRNISEKELILKAYSDILEGRIAKYPKDYFDGGQGYMRSRVLFLHMIRSYKNFSNLDEMYAFFANDKKAKHLLAKYRLSAPLRDLYASPLEYLHEALPPVQKSEELYQKHLSIRDGLSYASEEPEATPCAESNPIKKNYVTYTTSQCHAALQMYDKCNSISMTIIRLGYPTKVTLRKWIKNRNAPLESDNQPKPEYNSGCS